jgi:hypothetical protein
MVLGILSSLNPSVNLAPGFKALGVNEIPKPTNGRIWSSCIEGGVIYTCGLFTTAFNSVQRRYVAAYTIATDSWSVLGNGYFVGTDLRQVVVHNGVVYVAGGFTSILVGGNTIAASGLAQYDINSQVWSGTGVAPSTGVFGRGVVVDSSGTYLYFTASGMTSFNGTSVTGIARVTLANNAVSGMTSNYPTGTVDGLAVSGDVVYILNDNNGVFKWTGSTWTSLGAGLPTTFPYSIAFGPGGSTLIGYNNAVWYSADGSTGWSQLGTSSGAFYCTEIDPVTGAIYSAAAVANAPVRLWNGSSWTTFCTVTGGYVRDILFDNQRLYFFGLYTAIGGLTTTNSAGYYV